MMLPLSKTRISLPSEWVSVKAGMRPFGLMAVNQGDFCSLVVMSILRTVYERPSSARVMLILMPFGDWPVYRVMFGDGEVSIGVAGVLVVS